MPLRRLITLELACQLGLDLVMVTSTPPHYSSPFPSMSWWVENKQWSLPFKSDPFRKHWTVYKCLPNLTLDHVPISVCSLKCLQPLNQFYVQYKIQLLGQDHYISGVSDNLWCCAVEIDAEVKATSSSALFAASKSPWSSLAYLQILDKTSISREAAYVGDVISASTVIAFAASMFNSPCSLVRALLTDWLPKYDLLDGLTGRHDMH